MSTELILKIESKEEVMLNIGQLLSYEIYSRLKKLTFANKKVKYICG